MRRSGTRLERPENSRIGAELSDGPGHALGVAHLRLVEENTHWREAKGADRAHCLVISHPTALGHEHEVDLVRGVAREQREAVRDADVDLGGIGSAARDDDEVFSAHFIMR